MEAKELMIGDWVRLIADDSNECLQVSYVRKDGVGFNQYSHFFDDIEPIPLTDEMLEANGWAVRPNDGEYCSPIDISYKEPLRLQVGEDGNAFWWIVGIIIVVPINHVHELQHALRLCGLNELADNFKIK